MESLGSRSIAGETEWERNSGKNYIQKNIQSLCVLCTYVCSMNTFYTSPSRTARSITVLQCSLKSSTLTPKISFLTASWFLHRTGLPSYRSASRYSAWASPIGPNRSGPRLAQPMRPMLSLSLNNSHNNIVLLFIENWTQECNSTMLANSHSNTA